LDPTSGFTLCFEVSCIKLSYKTKKGKKVREFHSLKYMKKPRWYLSWTPWPVSGKTTLYLGELPM
jgi:hypothetical protein